MNFLIQFRSRVQNLIADKQTIVGMVVRFFLTLVALFVCNSMIGYQPILNHWWVVLLVSVFGAVVSIRATTVIILFYELFQLMSLSTEVAIVAVVLAVLGYLVCGYFQSKNTYFFVLSPVCYQLQIPFAPSIGGALFGEIGNLASVLVGAVFSFYLHIVSANATSFLEEGSEMTAVSLVQSRMLSSAMFYIYIIAVSVAFFVTYFIRVSKIQYSWLLGVASGVVSGFLIMLAGDLFVGSRSDIPSLIIGSIVTLAIGIVMAYLGRGANYARTEHVTFEDDDYFYYVTAVPKIRITEQEKELKKITEERE